jgi:hypothetical protein
MRRTFIAIVFLFSVLLWPSSARALTLVPAILDLKAKPGTIQDFKVELANEEDQTIFLQATWKKFAATGDHGAPQILPLVATDPLTNWLSLPGKYLQLDAHSKVVIPFRISVPQTASGGEYHLFLSWQTFSPTRPSGSGVSLETGSLIFLQVEKNLSPQLAVEDFKLSPDQRIYFSQPNFTVLRVNNSANVTEIPQGKLIMSGWGLLNNQTAVNLEKQRVLPGQNREFYLPTAPVSNWLKYWLVGKYQIDLQLVDQDGRAWGKYQLAFWLVSWPWLVVLLFILLLILGFIFRRKK